MARTYEDIEEAIGTPAFEKLCKVFGGEIVYIPGYSTLENTRKKKEIIAAIDRGEPIEKIAKKYGWSVNGVRRLAQKGHRKND